MVLQVLNRLMLDLRLLLIIVHMVISCRNQKGSVMLRFLLISNLFRLSIFAYIRIGIFNVNMPSRHSVV